MKTHTFYLENISKFALEKWENRRRKQCTHRFATTGHRPWPLVEETFITFKPPPRIFHSLYRWIRIEKTKNPAWTEKFISSPINTVLTKRLPQNFQNRVTFSQILQRMEQIKQTRIHTPKPNLNIVLNVCMTLKAWTTSKEKAWHVWTQHTKN